MKRTDFLTAAYDICMEILFIVLLLTSLDGNSELMQKLRSALEFYRQNKELIAMFASGAGAMKTQAAEQDTEEETKEEETKEEKESRSSEGKFDSMKILEEYLKRSAV